MELGPLAIPSKVPGAIEGVGRTVVVPPPPPPPPPPPVPPFANAGLAAAAVTASAVSAVKTVSFFSMCESLSGGRAARSRAAMPLLSRAGGLAHNRTLVLGPRRRGHDRCHVCGSPLVMGVVTTTIGGTAMLEKVF